MEAVRSRQIIIAGAGVAGLTAALAFAARGFSVHVYERSEELREVGAGLQLSPNATRLLGRLGVLAALNHTAVRPPAIVLKDAATLVELARVPLGDAAEHRWNAPYLVVHRADLQQALLASVARETEIRLATGATIRDVAIHRQGVTASVDIGKTIKDVRGLLLVGADGVWSTLRGLSGRGGQSVFEGHVAWRRTVRSQTAAELASDQCVTAFLHPGFHLVAYPVRSGSAVNLVAFTKGDRLTNDWAEKGDPSRLRAAMLGTAPALTSLVSDGSDWTTWPIHTVDPAHPWVAAGSLALIGDAAHAMTPFSAQGAAMAIEDAVTLADCVAKAPDQLADSLPRWEAERRKRIKRVARRGAFNRFAWHASGAVGRVRDTILRNRSPRGLASDMDWLYGFDPSTGKTIALK